MDIPAYILNHQSVVDLYGRWPSFHDANVLEYTAPDAKSQSLGFTLHTWQMTNEVDAKGFYVLRKHALVSFRFQQIYDVSMEKFRSGNILFEMQLISDAASSSFRVELNSVMDMSGSFSARSGEVISVIPCTSSGKVIQPT